MRFTAGDPAKANAAGTVLLVLPRKPVSLDDTVMVRSGVVQTPWKDTATHWSFSLSSPSSSPLLPPLLLLLLLVLLLFPACAPPARGLVPF